MRKLTAAQAIQLDILNKVLIEEGIYDPNFTIPDEAIDSIEDYISDTFGVEIQSAYFDYLYDFRDSGEESNIPCETSRYYESESRATRLSSGEWVGWTYWYGGGKHSYPGEINWLEGAYYLKEPKPKTIIIYEFEKED